MLLLSLGCGALASSWPLCLTCLEGSRLLCRERPCAEAQAQGTVPLPTEGLRPPRATQERVRNRTSLPPLPGLQLGGCPLRDAARPQPGPGPRTHGP